MIRSIAMAVFLALSLSACADPQIVDTSCASFQPIRYSASRDTPETVDQVRQHNAAWKALCGG